MEAEAEAHVETEAEVEAEAEARQRLRARGQYGCREGIGTRGGGSRGLRGGRGRCGP